MIFKSQDILTIRVQSVSFEDLVQIVKLIKPKHKIDKERLMQYYNDYRTNPTELIVDTIGVYFKRPSQLEAEEKEYAENFKLWVEEPFDLPPLEYCEKEREQLVQFHSYCKAIINKMSRSQQAFLFRLLINVYPPPNITIEEDFEFTTKICSEVSEKYCRSCENPICCTIHKSEFPSSTPLPNKSSEYCYFLGPKGCQIYNIRLKICRQWDCWKISDAEIEDNTNSEYLKKIRR